MHRSNTPSAEEAQAQFRGAVAQLTAQIAGRPLDSSLDDWLNTEHGAGSPSYQALKQSCEWGVAQGWLCDREGGGIKYGRIFKPADDLPTVTQGRALVLYLLPQGKIEFTKT
jgi:hypothetical protein